METTEILEEHELETLAERVLSRAEKVDAGRAAVVLLEGDLGAGKTTFTKALARTLSISDHVQSPTFILKKEYPTTHTRFTRLVHIDAYRFTHPKEGKVLRLEEDLKDPSAIVCIEWPNNLDGLRGDIMLSLEVVDETKRQVTFSYEK